MPKRTAVISLWHWAAALCWIPLWLWRHATNPGDLWDYVNGGTGKGQPLVNPGLPIVAITLTAGTGSEVNCWGVISNLETKEKIGFGYQELTPVLAVVDPELMKTVPAKYTAYQALTRCSTIRKS